MEGSQRDVYSMMRNQTLFISEEETNGVLKAYDLNQEYPF